MAQPIEGAGTRLMAGEIRSFVHSLPDGERMGFIQRAIDAGDMRTVGACIGGPAYLCGLTTEMQSALLRVHHEKANPRAAKQLRAAKSGLEVLGQRGGLIFREMEKAVGEKQAKVQQIRAAQAQAEQSFVA